MLSNLSAVQIIILIGCLIVSIAIHEAMHAFAAHALGDDTASREGRLTLNPLAHIDLLTTVLLPLVFVLLHQPPFLAAKPVPFRPDMVRYGEWGAALVGLAGPFTNLLLAVIGSAVFHLLGSGTSNLLYSIVVIFVEINIGMFVFNMIPFPPLDGSRLLYAVAPEPLQQLMARIEQFGIGAILVLVFLLYPLLSPIIVAVSSALLRFLLG